MNPGAVVFALANPDPEIDPLEAQTHAAVVATGRSDFPNQINNVLAFPGVFRGLLDAQATEITDDDAASPPPRRSPNVVSPDQLNASYIVPSVFDENVSKAVARAVVEASRSRGPGSAAAPRNRRCRERPVLPVAGRRPVTPALTHVDASGAARMVDVSAKEPTARTALATGVLRTTAEVVALLQTAACPRATRWRRPGSPASWRAKRTPDLVPLCHPISISGVTVDLEVGAAEVRISATVRTTDRTGVEMEALTAVAVAGLTLHDMIKAVDPAAVLDAVRVERKDGGKTGTWTRPEGR